MPACDPPALAYSLHQPWSRPLQPPCRASSTRSRRRSASPSPSSVACIGVTRHGPRPVRARRVPCSRQEKVGGLAPRSPTSISRQQEAERLPGIDRRPSQPRYAAVDDAPDPHRARRVSSSCSRGSRPPVDCGQAPLRGRERSSAAGRCTFASPISAGATPSTVATPLRRTGAGPCPTSHARGLPVRLGAGRPRDHPREARGPADRAGGPRSTNRAGARTVSVPADRYVDVVASRGCAAVAAAQTYPRDRASRRIAWKR